MCLVSFNFILFFAMPIHVPFCTLVYSHMRLMCIVTICVYEHFNYGFPLLRNHEKSGELTLESVLHNMTLKTATGSIMHDDCYDCGMLSNIALCLGGQESNI